MSYEGSRHILDRANSSFALPNRRVGVNSSGWWSRRALLLVVNFMVRNRYLALAILESLQNLLGGDLAVIGKEIRVVEKGKDIVRNLSWISMRALIGLTGFVNDENIPGTSPRCY